MNDYANSMFRFDHLNAPWIAACSAYLQAQYGPQLQDRTVLDYACGRGNWALAFAQAGASRVIAIDASADNCARLQQYLTREKIKNIEVVCGDILRDDFSFRVDFIWVHGILQHIPMAQSFIQRLMALAAGPHTRLHLYAYDRNSLREWVVERARRFACYATEAEFRADAPLLTHTARLRARDDLTAPYIHWWSAHELQDMISACGLVAVQTTEDFATWQTGKVNPEFQPHHVLCTWPGAEPSGYANLQPTPARLLEPQRLYADDLVVLDTLAAPFFDPNYVDSELGKKHALGLFNSHFSALASGGSTAALWENLLYLLYLQFSQAPARRANNQGSQSGALSEVLLALAQAALHDRVRPDISDLNLPNSYLLKQLCEQRIRL